jgi:hypothetical protein
VEAGTSLEALQAEGVDLYSILVTQSSLGGADTMRVGFEAPNGIVRITDSVARALGSGFSVNIDPIDGPQIPIAQEPSYSTGVIDINARQAQIVDTDDPSSIATNLEAEGNVTISTSLPGGYDAHDGTAILVDGATIESNSGDVLLQEQGDRSITIQNSSQLLALAGRVFVKSVGGNISVLDSSIQGGESYGEIVIDAMTSNSTTTPATVEIRNSTLMAQQIRARSYNVGGNPALIIDGSTLSGGPSPANLIRLFAEGNASLVFRNNVTLDAFMSELAGATVQVDSGGKVTVTGDLSIFRDLANYNIGGPGEENPWGYFQQTDVEAALSEMGFSSRPGFDD